MDDSKAKRRIEDLENQNRTLNATAEKVADALDIMVDNMKLYNLLSRVKQVIGCHPV